MDQTSKQPRHDEAPFARLLAASQAIKASAAAGKMFGAPAVSVGRRTAACVFGDAIALRVPEAVAETSIEEGRALSFRPFGRSAMRAWIELTASSDLDDVSALLQAALAFAEYNAAQSARATVRSKN